MEQKYESKQLNETEALDFTSISEYELMERANQLRAEAIAQFMQSTGQWIKGMLGKKKLANAEQDVISEDEVSKLGSPCY